MLPAAHAAAALGGPPVQARRTLFRHLLRPRALPLLGLALRLGGDVAAAARAAQRPQLKALALTVQALDAGGQRVCACIGALHAWGAKGSSGVRQGRQMRVQSACCGWHGQGVPVRGKAGEAPVGGNGSSTQQAGRAWWYRGAPRRRCTRRAPSCTPSQTRPPAPCPAAWPAPRWGRGRRRRQPRPPPGWWGTRSARFAPARAWQSQGWRGMVGAAAAHTRRPAHSAPLHCTRTLMSWPTVDRSMRNCLPRLAPTESSKALRKSDGDGILRAGRAVGGGGGAGGGGRRRRGAQAALAGRQVLHPASAGLPSATGRARVAAAAHLAVLDTPAV